ncbi:MAG: Holliday junction resolvase RuvX [Patescibacteria group bacterium]
MRILGIDYGTKKIGIALSDQDGQFAIPLIVINYSKNLLQDVLEIVKENEVKEIVMGESKNYNGEANAILDKSLEFKKLLEQNNLRVHLEPEFMTSENAERIQGKHDMLDASSAALILQSFLDKKNIKR